MIRLLWAQALDDDRTAIVIDKGFNELLGGVAYLKHAKFETTTEAVRGSDYVLARMFIHTMDLYFRWEWFKVVSTPEEFRDSKEWQSQIAETKLITALTDEDWKP